MENICIKEARPEDAAQLIAFLQKVGGETDEPPGGIRSLSGKV